MTLPKLPSWGEVAAPAAAPAPAAVAAPPRPAKATPTAKAATPRPARTKTSTSRAAATKTSRPKASPAQPADAVEPVAPTAPEGVIVRGPARFIGDTDERPARQLATEILSAAVGIVTGGAASTPRPGQATLSSDIFATMDSIGHMVGAAPTGSGKSLAYLAPAAALAAKRGERTVISTESLTLQGQVVDKDLPTIAAATVEVCGFEPTFAIHKGWSNFACTVRTSHVAGLVLEQLGAANDPFNDTFLGLVKMTDALEALAAQPRLDERRVTIDRVDFPARPVVDVLTWAMQMIVRRTAGHTHDSGDRDQCPVDIPDALWPMLSTSTGGCIGVKDCPFGDACLPARSRDRASDADIVVTNHALLGIQAAKGVPVVIGSRKLGIFHHIVVDEAHGLPEWVRGAGAAEVSGVRIDRLVGRLERAWGRMAPPDGLFQTGRALAIDVDDHLATVAVGLQSKSKDQRNKDRLEVVLELAEDDDPIAEVAQGIESWLARCADELAVVRKILKSNPAEKDQMIAVWRASEAVDSLRGELADASDPDLDVARWMEWIPTGEGPKAVVKLSPVNVGGLLAGRVWTGKLPDEAEAALSGRPIPKARPSSELEAASEAANAGLAMSSADHEDFLDGTLEVGTPLIDSLDQWGADDGSDSTETDSFYDLSVTTLSATIPNSFPRDAGVRARTDRYPSPFADAYAGSLLFIPRVTQSDPDFARLESRWSQPDRPKFDTARHPEWAVEQMIELVEANGGSALILSATSAAGQMYADRLTRAARGRWKVRSQWDPASRSKTIAQWREDRTGVLVGTKSLMTGVDAPGDTCSLVILDRVPRSRNNPVDEARTNSVAAATDTDYWSATNATYVSDAATLLEQAAGRLIRSGGDRGVFAFLDPRLHPKSAFKMAARDRRTYMAALEAFVKRSSDRSVVDGYLGGQKAAA